MNCGHVYHLSCIRRWFECKSSKPTPRGHQRTTHTLPPHAPCPKCKEPFDMGSTVTIYLDLVAKETPPAKRVRQTRASTGAAAWKTPTGKGKSTVNLVSSDDDDDVVPESPNDTHTRRLGFRVGDNATGRSGEHTSTSPRTSDEINSLRVELNAATVRAREAEDALAAAEMRHEAGVAEDDALSDQVESLTRELGRAREQLKAATYVEGQAKTKLDKATSELRERNGECVRLRGKVSALETQRKLDRDLAHTDGRVVGEADLVKRFGAESLVDPKGTYLAFHQIP